MKKLLILALVALVAGSAFAMTDPAFSGDFEFFAGYDFVGSEAEFGDSGEASINLNGVVDEYSTVNAELSGDFAGTTANPVSINAFTLTTDITGALGVAGPVGLSITWGAQDFEPADYAGVAGYEDTAFNNDTDTYVGTVWAITFADMLTINAAIYPGTYTDLDGTSEEMVGAVEVQYVSGAISANAFYTYDPNLIGMEIGTTLAYVTDMLEVGFGLTYMEMLTETLVAGIAALYNVTDTLGVGFAFGTTDILNGNFASTSNVALNAVFDATDVVQLYASAVLGNFEAIEFKFDAGAAFALGGVTYTIGYDYGGAGFKTPDWGLTEGLYFKVSASF